MRPRPNSIRNPVRALTAAAFCLSAIVGVLPRIAVAQVSVRDTTTELLLVPDRVFDAPAGVNRAGWVLPGSAVRTPQGAGRREHRSLAQEGTHVLTEALDAADRPSLMELEGLGRELWCHTDVAEYIDQERRCWD